MLSAELYIDLDLVAEIDLRETGSKLALSMMSYTATILVLLALPACLISGQLIQVCDPDTFVGDNPTTPPLPSVPNQFSSTIEGNLVHRSQSVVVTEYYDQVGDRGRIEFTINGTKEIGIFDYTLGEVFLIPDPRGGDCRVFQISPSSQFLAMAFGFTQVNGSLHIGSPAAFLERIQGQNASTIYLGEDTVRGIPVLRWQSCVAMPNNTFVIDYYFTSQSNWTYGTQLDTSIMVPVQFSLNASFIGRRGVDNAYNIYTFVNFQSGPSSVPDELFVVPTGLACKGRNPGQPLPSLPDTFSGRMELTTKYQNNTVLVSLQEYYDYQRNLFRLDYYDRTGPTSVIHDFNQGVQFRIDQNTNKCNVIPLSNISVGLNFDFDVDANTPQIASPGQIFLLQNLYNYSYEGVSTVRGLEVDSWVSVRDFEKLPGGANLTDAVFEIFFTRPGVVVVNEHSVTPVPVPVRAKLRGNFSVMAAGSVVTFFRDLQYEFFDFSTQHPPYDAYDVSPCYDHDDIVSVVLLIPGQLTGFNLGAFTENIRVGISNFTGISPLQVASVNLLGVDRNGTNIYVHVHIANLTSLATSPVEERVTAASALQLLLDGTSDPSQPFTIVIPPNITVAPSIHAQGQGRGVPVNCSCDVPTTPPATTPPPTTTTTPPTTTTTPPTTLPPMTQPPSTTMPTPRCNTTDNGGEDLQQQLALKNRELIGIAIGLLFGGMLIGALVMLVVICVCRCACGGGKGSYKVRSNVQYKKHQDDIAFDT